MLNCFFLAFVWLGDHSFLIYSCKIDKKDDIYGSGVEVKIKFLEVCYVKDRKRSFGLFVWYLHRN